MSRENLHEFKAKIQRFRNETDGPNLVYNEIRFSNTSRHIINTVVWRPLTDWSGFNEINAPSSNTKQEMPSSNYNPEPEAKIWTANRSQLT